MDTIIGKFALTKNQIYNLETLKDGKPFHGHTCRLFADGVEVEGVSEEEPTEEELKATAELIKALPEKLHPKLAQKYFVPDECKFAFYDKLALRIAQLAPFWGPLSDMINFRNFKGIKAYRDGLASANVLTSQDITDINEIFSLQGVDLDNLGD